MLASNMEEDAFYMGEPTQGAEYQSWAAHSFISWMPMEMVVV